RWSRPLWACVDAGRTGASPAPLGFPGGPGTVPDTGRGDTGRGGISNLRPGSQGDWPTGQGRPHEGRRRKMGKDRAGMRHRWSWTQVAFIAPAAVLLVVFLLVPFVMAFWLSLTNMRLVPGPLPTQFVGLANYQRMLGDGQFWTSLGNNLLFAAVVVPVQSALALGLALLVNQKLRFTTVFRTIYFMPTVTPMVVV